MRPTSLISCVLLCGTAISQVVMIPLAAADDIDNTETDDMTKMVQTGAIPESLLNDILKQAGTYMSLYNTNPSQFLKGFGIGKKNYATCQQKSIFSGKIL